MLNCYIPFVMWDNTDHNSEKNERYLIISQAGSSPELEELYHVLLTRPGYPRVDISKLPQGNVSRDHRTDEHSGSLD